MKLIRLIFSSDKEGEIVGAVMAARRVLATNGLDCHWVADRIAAPVAQGDHRADRRDDDDDDHRDDKSAIWFAWHRRRFLSPKEHAFIENIVERARPLTPKQRKWVFDICDRMEAA
jgi:DNA-binding transcriptional LysR family regulator